jgi:class 3 adenylate cyclase
MIYGFVDKYIGDAVMALFPRNPAELLDLFLNTKAEFEKAVEYAEKKDFESSLSLFESVLASNPVDRAAQYYSQRIQKALSMRKIKSSVGAR